MKKCILKLFSKITKRSALFLLMLLLSISYSLRYEHFNNTTGSANLEASYHTLLTIKSLKESPSSNHYFLPTVTLGKENDKFISWGSTLPTKTGDYVYTSFTPPGFLFPYLIFTILDLDITLKNLAHFNFTLNVIFAFLLFNFLLLILNKNNYCNKNSILAALFGTVLSIFSTEALISFGVVYWVHSINQIFLLCVLYQFAKYIKFQQPATSNQQPATSNQQPATSNQQPATSLILLSIFLCAYTEWTGYILGLSISVILYTEYFKIKNRKLSFYIIISLFLSAFITISHYIYAVGFDSISVIIERFTARNAGNNSITFIDLLNGYITSYNLFFVFLFIFLPILVSNTKQRINNVHTILILSISILFENIIMLQHATQFSFDRLKMIIPLAILFSLIFIKGKSILRILLIIALIISSIYSITIYNKELARFKDWNIIDKRNIAFIHVIKNYIDFNCASFAMNLPVRGYDNLLIERGIIENISFDNFKQRNIGCGMVYFNTSRYSSDLNRYDMATIVLPNMQKIILRPVIQADWNQFITDSNWENGIARRWSGFYLPKQHSLVGELSVGDTIILPNGENRTITRLSHNELYTNIDLDGNNLDIKQIPNPSFIFQLISE